MLQEEATSIQMNGVDPVRVCSRSGSGGSTPDSQSLEEKSDRSNRQKKGNIRHLVSEGARRSTKSNSPPVSLNGSTVISDTGSGVLWETASLQREVDSLRAELAKANKSIAALQEREKKMKDRLAEQAQKMLERGVRFENLALGEKRPTALVRRYGNLYAQARVDTLDALDSLPQLQEAHELKSKLLFSVVVLAFRSVQNSVADIKSSVRGILQMPEGSEHDTASDPASRDLEASIGAYLRSTVERFDVSRNVSEVCSQIWATLYDYPCLKTCDGLIQYIRDCVRLAWSLSNQHPPFVIEYETRTFRRDMHVRFHTSNQESEHIKTYLWPTLLEGENGPSVHKGVVVT